MKKNIGSLDKNIRILIAIVIVVLYFRGAISGATAIVMGIVAAILTITASLQTCPLYLPFGINTLKKKENDQ